MSKAKKTGKKKRELDKYPALNPRLNARTRFEVLDMDYLKKLSDQELVFMNQFMAEYVSGSFKKDETGDYSSDNLHKTGEERRECYSRNNMRNRCGLTVSNATGQTYRCDDIGEFMDTLADIDSTVDNSNSLSNTLHDEYGGSYDALEEEIREEMLKDYMLCINPKTSSDRKMVESNYGKRLMVLFKDIHLKKED
jgi:hypothetical protein